MSASKSFLSDARYGYDVVVAVTQDSINATMKQFLNKLEEPVVTVCIVADENARPALMDFARLLEETGGVDPFAIPAGADPQTTPEMERLQHARFMAGFRARLGLPPGVPPYKLPHLVELGSDTAAVTFNMLCSEFDVVQFIPAGGYSPATWLHLAQPAGTPWIIRSKVDLRLSEVDDNAYHTLPEDVKGRIKNLDADAFSVQQLLFDLTNARLAAGRPEIEGVTPGSDLELILDRYFLGVYFDQLQKGGQPVLGTAITHRADAQLPSSFALTDLNFHVNPVAGDDGRPLPQPTLEQQGLATLNYLCAINHRALPPAVAFSWNWVDPQEKSDFHGVAVTNKTAFVDRLRLALDDHARHNCVQPSVRVTLENFYTTVKYRLEVSSYQEPVVVAPTTGSVVLQYDYQSERAYDEAGVSAIGGSLEMKSSYHMDATLAGDTITITQHLLVYLSANNGAISGDGNVVDRTMTDTYTLGITDQGELTTTTVSQSTDNSQNPDTGWLDFLGGFLHDVLDRLDESVRNFVSPSFHPVPMNAVQDYVFPGGKTFAFKAVGFSDNQDLVAHITYADPV